MKGISEQAVTAVNNKTANRLVTVGTTDDDQCELDAEANLTFDGSTLALTGDQTISGNLTVSGTQTNLSTTNTIIEDKLIELANGTSGTPSGDSGLIIERGSSNNAAIIWDESRDEFVLGTTTATGASTGDLSVTPGNVSVERIGAGTEQAEAEVHAKRDASSGGTYSTNAPIIIEDDARPALQFVGSANNIALIEFGDNAAASSGQLYYDHSTDKLRVDCGGNTDRLTVDASGNVAVAGELDAASLDISGDADIDGTLEADAITVDGTALNEFIADTVGAMVGSNTETGIAVSYEDGDNTLDFAIDAAQTGITSVVNSSLEIGRDADNRIKFGTDNQIIFEVDGGDNVIFKASGEIEASSLDISGDADIDGTLEADAITVDGTALSEVIQDTVGAMVGSNTETGITVTYEDGDGTLDFVLDAVGTNAIADNAVTVAKIEDLARGNIIYGNASAQTAALAPGSNGTVLTSDGTDISWQASSGGGTAANDANLILHMQVFS